MEDVSRVLVEMSQLRMRLPGEFEKNETEFSLYDYMTCLKSYAEKIIQAMESEHEIEQSIKEIDETANQGAFLGDQQLFGAYIGDKPDSAIDVSVESASKPCSDPQTDPEDERIPTIEELMASFVGVPSRAPTPPPKDRKRLELARSLMASPFHATSDHQKNSYDIVTEIVSQGPPTESPPSITKSKGLGKFFAPIKHAISESRPQTRSTTSTGTTDIHPATPIIQASLVRRGSRRLSVSFKKLPMWNSEQIMAEPEDTTPNAVFGVSLQKSMQVAKGTAKTHHSGHGGSS
ncbi:hypothetical protein PC116_g30219, partial [Phytophthora cactorum]